MGLKAVTVEDDDEENVSLMARRPLSPSRFGPHACTAAGDPSIAIKPGCKIKPDREGISRVAVPLAKRPTAVRATAVPVHAIRFRRSRHTTMDHAPFFRAKISPEAFFKLKSVAIDWQHRPALLTE